MLSMYADTHAHTRYNIIHMYPMHVHTLTQHLLTIRPHENNLLSNSVFLI